MPPSQTHRKIPCFGLKTSLGILFGAVFLDIWGAETNIKKGLIAMFWTALFLVALIFVEKNKEEN